MVNFELHCIINYGNDMQNNAFMSPGSYATLIWLIETNIKDKMIPEEMKDFVNSEEGEKVFEELCEAKNKQMLRDRKKSFLDPPANVKRWYRMFKTINYMTMIKNKK